MNWIEQLKKKQANGTIRGFTIKGKEVKKKTKYNNSKVEWNGELFDSKKELKVYRQLLLRLKLGEIGQLERQVRYVLIEASEGQRSCVYIADFRFMESSTGETKVMDAKGFRTQTFIIKKKLMKDRYGIDVIEV